MNLAKNISARENVKEKLLVRVLSKFIIGFVRDIVDSHHYFSKNDKIFLKSEIFPPSEEGSLLQI
jgi:hypothetical protein